MYGSNRVKRRPSPYEMEITDGESGLPLRWLLGGFPILRTVPRAGMKTPDGKRQTGCLWRQGSSPGRALTAESGSVAT